MISRLIGFFYGAGSKFKTWSSALDVIAGERMLMILLIMIVVLDP